MTFLGVTDRLAFRLTTEQAQHYAARFRATGRWRVTVFGIGYGRDTLELRTLPGFRPQVPPITLRTASECEALLKEVRK